MAQQRRREGDVLFAVDGEEIAVLPGWLSQPEGNVEDCRKTGGGGDNSGIPKGFADPVHEPAALSRERGMKAGGADLFQGRHCRGHREALPVVGAAVHHVADDEAVEDVGPAGDRRNRKAVGDCLGEDSDVGSDSKQLLRAAARKAKPGDRLVEDQKAADLPASLLNGR